MCMNRSVIGTVRVLAVAGVVLVVSAGWQPQAQGALRAGTAVANITVDKPTVPVHDPLLAKILVLEGDTSTAVIICMDLEMAVDPLVREIRGGIERELRIPQSNVLVNVAQNHRGGGQEAPDIGARVVAAVKQARQKLVPARIGVGVGSEDRITMNRRLRTKDGKHWTIRRATPSPANADVVGLGPIDPQIGLLRVDTAEGKPLALVYNFTGHPYGGVPDGSVTADFPAFASRVIEEAWPGAVALFLQGFCGDITPIHFKDFDEPQPTIELGTKLGQSALKAAQGIATSDTAVICAVREVVDLPRRTDTAERIAALLAEQERILQSFAPRGGAVSLNLESFLALEAKYKLNPEWPVADSYAYRQEELSGQKGLKQLDADNKNRLEIYRRCVEKMDRLITLRTNLGLLRGHVDNLGGGPIPADIQALRIGDFVVITFPGEPFAEVGLRIKKQSPSPYTFVAGNSNGEVAGHYGPTSDAYDKQAYGDSITELAPEWQQVYERKALEIIGRLQ